MRATIELITAFILLLAERLGFSVARNLELRGLNTQVLEILLGSPSSLFSQNEIVRYGASFIAMTFDLHNLTFIGAKPFRIGIQHRHCILADMKPIVIE
jgi:hypothetical protein